MDIDLGNGISGPEAGRQILSIRKIPIVFLTSHSEKEYVERVKQITRYGYVLKTQVILFLTLLSKWLFTLANINRFALCKYGV